MSQTDDIIDSFDVTLPKERSFLEYFTTWTLIMFLNTTLLGIIFPGKLPLWFLIGIVCQMLTVSIIGTFICSSSKIYNASKNNISQYTARDFFVHILPFIFIMMFYGPLSNRFYYSINVLKSSIITIIISIIYIATHDIKEIYELNSEIIIILSLATWLSSYQIFVN